MTKEKTLSEQLCELCGIKPKLNVAKSYKEKQNIKDIYPDFENPENFVKLLELEIRLPWYNEPSILAHFLNYYCCNLGSRKNFLNDVIDFISDKDECYPVEEINIIKQAIRDYDGWVWG